MRSSIRRPTAVLVGSQDKITPLPLSEMMRARIPDAEHFTNAENPAAFIERLIAS